MERENMKDTAIRPIPGFPRYFAGDDGRVYRLVQAHHAAGTERLYLNVKDPDGRQVRHPLSWFVGRAWVDGCAPGMRAHHIDLDPLNSRPDNIEWVPIGGRSDKELRDAKRAEMEADPGDPRHGTKAGYRYGCGCDRCRAMGPVVNRSNILKKTLKELA